jgi:uncharacterized RDD family membrane protein YckC
MDGGTMSLLPWGDRDDLPHREPLTPAQAIGIGAVIVILILLIAIPGCAAFVVELAGS